MLAALQRQRVRVPTTLALCLLLAGCPFFTFRSGPVERQGPAVANHFPEDVESEVRLTDGTVRRQTFVPCREYHFFEPQWYDPWRQIFVERLTFRQGGAVIGEYEGARVEALGAFGGVAVLDESGLRRVSTRRCSRVFNTAYRDVHMQARYADGSTASLILRHCQPHLWTGIDLLRDESTPAEDAVPTRLTISHDGKVIHDLDEPTFRSKFRLHLQATRTMTYAIDRSVIIGVPGVAPPKRCSRLIK